MFLLAKRCLTQEAWIRDPRTLFQTFVNDNNYLKYYYRLDKLINKQNVFT